MSVNGHTRTTTSVCIIFLLQGPRPVGRTSLDRDWNCVVASTLNETSKRSISCMTSNTIVHNLRMCKSFGDAISYV